jgi:hypothetical protein
MTYKTTLSKVKEYQGLIIGLILIGSGIYSLNHFLTPRLGPGYERIIAGTYDNKEHYTELGNSRWSIILLQSADGTQRAIVTAKIEFLTPHVRGVLLDIQPGQIVTFRGWQTEDDYILLDILFDNNGDPETPA